MRCRPAPARRSAASASVARRASGFTSERVRARSRSGDRDRRASGSAAPCARARAPSPAATGRSAEHRPGDGALPGGELDDDQLALRGRARRPIGVDADRNRLVVAGKALGRALDCGLGGAEERVDAGEQLRPLVLCAVAPRSARWRRTSRPSSSPPRGAPPTRGSGAPARSRGRRRSAPSESVAARFARTPIGNATRSLSDVGTAAPIATTSPTMPRCRARRPSSRSAARDDGATIVTVVTAAPQGLRGAADVLVDIVRLRPRERRHEADAERHRARILAPASSHARVGR